MAAEEEVLVLVVHLQAQVQDLVLFCMNTRRARRVLKHKSHRQLILRSRRFLRLRRRRLKNQILRRTRRRNLPKCRVKKNSKRSR